MSEQENMLGAWDMVSAWIITLLAVLNGYIPAVAAMELAGEEKKIIEVSMEAMRQIRQSYTSEDRQMLSSQLELLSRLANES